MKKIVTAGLMLATLTGGAFAADLPSRVAPPAYVPPPLPIFTWTGAYFGVNAGYAFGHEGRYTAVEGALALRREKVNSDGFTGGGQIGYNYQFPGGGYGGQGGGIVVGVEADASYTDLDRSRTFAYGGPVTTSLFGTNTTYRSGLDFLGTIRGRVGYAFGQFLVYGTGGFAYGGLNNSVTVRTAGNALIGSGSVSKIETGYTYGGGIEYALPTSSFLNFFKSSAVTIKAEYLHYDLGRSKFAITGGGLANTTARVSNEGDLARVGLNYKFGSY